MKHRLEVTGLEVRMGRSGPDVVRDISFAVPAGEVLGLVGESGSGKTTVALALLGHTRSGLRITAGRVVLDAQPHAPGGNPDPGGAAGPRRGRRRRR